MLQARSFSLEAVVQHAATNARLLADNTPPTHVSSRDVARMLCRNLFELQRAHPVIDLAAPAANDNANNDSLCWGVAMREGARRIPLDRVVLSLLDRSTRAHAANQRERSLVGALALDVFCAIHIDGDIRSAWRSLSFNPRSRDLLAQWRAERTPVRVERQLVLLQR